MRSYVFVPELLHGWQAGVLPHHRRQQVRVSSRRALRHKLFNDDLQGRRRGRRLRERRDRSMQLRAAELVVEAAAAFVRAPRWL